MERTTDVAVIGGGAAGLSAALFVARAGLSAVVIDQERSIIKRAKMHNLPGAGATEGREYLADLRGQAAAAGVSIESGKVRDVVPGDGFAVHIDGSGDADSDEGSALRARYLVLASGQGTVTLPSLTLATDPPRQPFVKANVRTDRWGETSIPNVWAAGLVAGWPSQVVICAGSGAAVGIEIASRDKGEFWVDHDDSSLPRDPS
ncbi:MAG TPA: FAD-dependent oxidoreductase [Ilumatobacteraceae bacterium]|nr:FAD-dependent oxidoreductase [Ilumatobacteraceae bacterium]